MKKLFFYTSVIVLLAFAYHAIKSKNQFIIQGFYMVFKQPDKGNMLLVSGKNPSSTTGLALTADKSQLKNVIITDLRKQSLHVFFDDKGNFKGAGLFLTNEAGEAIELWDETFSGNWQPIDKRSPSK